MLIFRVFNRITSLTRP